MYKNPPVLESLFNTLADLKACNFIKKSHQQSCFPKNIAKFLRTVFFTENLWRLSLNNYLQYYTRNTLQSRKFCRRFYISHILSILSNSYNSKKRT